MITKLKEWLYYWDSLDGAVKVVILLLYGVVTWEFISLYFNHLERKHNARKRNRKQ